MNMKFCLRAMALAVTALFLSLGVASCGSDNDEDEPTPPAVEENLFSAEKIINTWVLTQDKVKQADGSYNTVNYSGGNTAPYYTYNKVVKGPSEGELIWRVYEYPANNQGSLVLKRTFTFKIDGKKLYTTNGELAGTVTGWDPSHKYANLVITWEPTKSPKGWSGECISSYLNGDWVNI